MYSTLTSQTLSPQKAVISVERIWDRAGHNAFTDFIKFKDKFYCCFREGSGHVYGINGTVRILSSIDGQNWFSVAHLYEKDVDLRDPKLSITPDGRIMVIMGGSFYEGKKFLKREPWVSFSDTDGKNFSNPQNISIDAAIKSDVDWLWRVTWFKGKGYGVVYQAFAQEFKAHLVSTTDGVNYFYITTFNITGKPNEATLCFASDGKVIAIIRREGEDKYGFIGTSNPPYKKWLWENLGIRLGGPDFIRLPDGSLLCGTRNYQFQKNYKTSLFKITTDGNSILILNLPSSGDTGYPGLFIDGNILYVSYYSSHEGKTAVYLAKLWINSLLH